MTIILTFNQLDVGSETQGMVQL